jgi:uracil-DNA glycosylase
VLTLLNDASPTAPPVHGSSPIGETIAAEKRKQFEDWTYWGRPVPGFGDSHARLYVLGLAPAAHGGNRPDGCLQAIAVGTGCMTPYIDLAFANQPGSHHRDDGLKLSDCYIGATVRCAPPDNKPAPEEFKA